MHINLSKKNTQTGLQPVQTEKNSLIILGANGSGKTRLGSWIENYSEYKNKTHRISAQKSISFPGSANLKPLDVADTYFRLGVRGNQRIGEHQLRQLDTGFEHFRKSYKYGENVHTNMVEDFQSLIDYLFSFENQLSVKYKNQAKQSHERIEPPMTLLDRLKKIWESLLSTKELTVESQSIKTQLKGSDIFYSAQEMSDGERVIFYLIGQCLCVPENSFIIVDEPELHIHKSLQSRLWKELEQERSDCNFIYLTHDIDFAANHRTDVIWMKSYDGMNWDWEVLDDLHNLPADLIYEIVGSRQPILFIEGTKGSFDYQLFNLLFPKFLIKPLGSCRQVIQTVKSIKNIPQLSGLRIYGLIDRDRRPDHEIHALENDGIYTLKVAEIENMFLIPDILKAVCENQAEDVQSFQQAMVLLFTRLSQRLHKQIMERVHSEMIFILGTADLPKNDISSMTQALQQLSTFDLQREYDDFKQKLEEIISTKDFDKLLAVYNEKELLKEVSKHIFKFTNWEKYPRIALKLVSEREELKKCLGHYIPQKLWDDNKDYAHPMS